MPVGELRQRVSAAEMRFWRAFYQLDPWGEQRADMRNAMAIVNALQIAGAKPRGGGRWKITDFLPFRVRSKRQQELEAYHELRAGLRALKERQDKRK